MNSKLIENIQIHYLVDVPDYIPLLAQWNYDAWSKYNPDLTVAGSIEKLKTRLNKNRIPLVFVAIYNKTLIASVTLKEHIPFAGYEDRNLWLGSLLVKEDYQTQGIGSYIVQHALKIAKSLGYSKISLFSSDPKASKWYNKNGWNHFATDIYQNHPVSLFEKSF